jgi:uncharacterized protein
MNNAASIYLLALIGIFAGVLSGFFGLGGGIIIVPALVYLAGYSQKMAVGTSLAILLPPIGLAAVIEYYKNGNVNFRAAIIVAIFLFVSAWVSSVFANKVNESCLRILFGVLMITIGASIVISSLLKK